MKVLYGIFPNCNGVVAKIPSKKTECVTKGVYMHKILSDVQKHYKIRRPNSEIRGIKFYLTMLLCTPQSTHMIICLQIEYKNWTILHIHQIIIT